MLSLLRRVVLNCDQPKMSLEPETIRRHRACRRRILRDQPLCRPCREVDLAVAAGTSIGHRPRILRQQLGYGLQADVLRDDARSGHPNSTAAYGNSDAAQVFPVPLPGGLRNASLPAAPCSKAWRRARARQFAPTRRGLS